MKILIVDDDRSIAEAITFGLELQWNDVQVISAADGEAGLDMFIKELPDLVLLDITMPKMNGWEVLKRIREFSTTPVILLTARGEEMERSRAWNWARTITSRSPSATWSSSPASRLCCAAPSRSRPRAPCRRSSRAS